MNRNVMIGVGVAIVLLILLGAGGFMMMSKKDQIQVEEKVTSKETQIPTTGVMMSKKSLKDMMGMGSNQTCTFEDENQNSGTVFTGGGKYRADLVSTANGEVINTHMISDGVNVYMWFDGKESGFKMPIAEVEKTSSAGDTSTTQNVDVNKQVDVNCKGWSVENSKFELPELVEFQDLGAMMKGVVNISPVEGAPTTGGGDVKAAQCAACNSFPADAKAQCMAALGCK